MEAMQLITRTPSKTDQRKVLVALTDSGRAMREQAAEIPFKLMNRLSNDISPAQMEEAAMLKNKLYELIHLLEKAEKQ
jgi:DNA-binding MarR family transcriptional regulator